MAEKKQPDQPKAEKTEEKAPEKPKVAHFFAPESSNLTIWLEPKLERVVGTSRMIDENSGLVVRFSENYYNTDNPEIIERLVDPKMGFELDYFPDPRDPSGFWRERGYFEEKTERKLVRKEDRLKTWQRQAEKTAGVIVDEMRTSNT